MARPKITCGVCGYRAQSGQGLKTHNTRLHESGNYVRDLQAENRQLRRRIEALEDRLRRVRQAAGA